MTASITNDNSRAALRRDLRARRAALSAAQRVAAAQGLVAQVEQVPEFITDHRIAGYWATAGELPLAALMAGVLARGQIWHLPIVADDGLLRFAPWRMGDALAPNRYGIPEPVCAPGQSLSPQEMDVVLVPLLGFDRSGHRLGFGGGYYDRSFSFLQSRGRRQTRARRRRLRDAGSRAHRRATVGRAPGLRRHRARMDRPDAAACVNHTAR
jgi:5-formyltetrahydrofolate cyclo-ligase